MQLCNIFMNMALLQPSAIHHGKCAASSAASLPCRIRSQRHRQTVPCAPTITAAANADATGQKDVFSGVQRVARKIQAALPIVGLFSRLTATSGGISSDVLSYPEYCRKMIDAAPAGFDQAVAEWEDMFGKEASRRNTLLCLWMAADAPGILPARTVILAARRLRVTFDIEIEMDRFDGARDKALKQYDYVDRPPAPLTDQINLAVDSLCTLGPGLAADVPLDSKAAGLLTKIIAGAFAKSDGVEDAVRQSLASMPSRAKAYAP